MKTYEQLAQAGHEAFEKESLKQFPGHTPTAWAELSDAEKACHIAAAQQVVAEMAALGVVS